MRSTRRRQDVPDLPRLPMSSRTVGKTLTSPTGKTYRPSMFLTLTLPSYGRVGPDGTPVNPAAYDYRSAALDAMHFSKAVDRLWQNLRRCAGYKVQYFSAVEAQRRLAMHLHAAVRGIIPRSVVMQVIRATYHQVWWPAFDEPRYTQRVPVWKEHLGGYTCPYLGHLLPTWEQALDDLDDQLDADPAMEPAHVVRFGAQADYQWFIPDSRRTDKRVGYVTKYLTKDLSATYGDRDSINATAGRPPGPADGPGPLAALLARMRELAALRHPAPGRRARHGSRCLPETGARPGEPRLRRPPGPGLAAVDRQDADRAQGRPCRSRPPGPGRGRDRPRGRRPLFGNRHPPRRAAPVPVAAPRPRPGRPRACGGRRCCTRSENSRRGGPSTTPPNVPDPATTPVRQPHPRGLPIASPLRPVVRLSGVSEANHEVTEGP